MAQVAAHHGPSSSWSNTMAFRFNSANTCILRVSFAQDVCLVFLTIFKDEHENLAINGLQHICFSCNVPVPKDD